jgi:very-short-patch-repair endonuclease
VRGHSGLRREDVVLLDGGLRVVRTDVTWGDLADRLTVDDLVVLGDAMLRRGLSTLDALNRIASGTRHRRGVRLLRLAVPLLEPRTDSPMETRVRLLLVRAGLPCPQANRDVVVDGEWIARPDLSYPHLRIAIEYDGDHHRSRRQWRSDRARRQLLEDAGWVVLELTADDVLRRPEATVERVRRVVCARAR